MKQKELSWRERGRLWLRLGIRLLGLIILLIVCRFALGPIVSLFMPFVLALLLAWALNPLIKRIQRKSHIPRNFLSLVLVLVLMGLVGGAVSAFVYGIIREIVALAANWQTIWTGTQQTLNALTAYLDSFPDLLPDEVKTVVADLLARLLAWLQQVIPAALSNMATKAGTWAMGLPSFGVALLVFLMGSYFITADYPSIRRRATDNMSSGVRMVCRQIKMIVGTAFGGYIKAQVFLSIGVFFILLGGFLIIRQPYALLLAFLLAVLDFIPLLGAGTVMVPWAVIDLLVYRDTRHAVSLLVVWGVIALYRRVAEPKVVGSQTGLSPVVSLVSIYIGMRLAGVTGMVLAPILCMVVLNICASGLFDGLARDVKAAAGDIVALLHVEEP